MKYKVILIERVYYPAVEIEAESEEQAEEIALSMYETAELNSSDVDLDFDVEKVK